MDKKKYILILLIVVLILIGTSIIIYLNSDRDIVSNEIKDEFDDDIEDNIYGDTSINEEDSVDEDKLVFSIRSSRVNCYTNTLYVYNNNT